MLIKQMSLAQVVLWPSPHDCCTIYALPPDPFWQSTLSHKTHHRVSLASGITPLFCRGFMLSALKLQSQRRIFPGNSMNCQTARRRLRFSRQRFGARGSYQLWQRSAAQTRNRCTTSTAISGALKEHRHQTGFLDVTRRVCSASLPLVVRPEDPLAAGKLTAVWPFDMIPFYDWVTGGRRCGTARERGWLRRSGFRS